MGPGEATRRCLCSRGELSRGRKHGFHGAGTLPPPPETGQRTSPAARVTGEGTVSARESGTLATGVRSPEGEAPASEGGPGVTRQADPGNAASVATGNSHTARNREETAPGHSLPTLTQPSVTPATSGANAPMAKCAGKGGRTQAADEVDRWIWKGITSDEGWEKNQNKPGTNLSMRGRRAAPGPC